MPVQYSYTSTPPRGSTACTEPQCLYKGTLYLLSLPPAFRGTVIKEYERGPRKFCQANVEEREKCNDLVADGRLNSTCNFIQGYSK